MMLKKYAVLVLILLVGIFLAACAAPAQPGGGSQTSLEGQEWVLAELNGQAPLAGAQATANFENGSISGSTGCNSYGGEYSLDGENLTMTNLYQTEMACMEPEGVMVQEAAFAQAMAQAASYQASADRLEIFSASGETLLVFTR